MIPKKLHYVGVGGNPIPKKIKDIMNQAKKVLGKEGTIKVWTEDEFNIESNPYTKYGYKKKQGAFVSDYIRAYVVHKEGGGYTDTDVWLSQSLEPLNKYDYVASRTYIVENTMSIFGSTPNNEILKTYLDVSCHPKMIKKPPRIMSTHIHTFAIRKHMNVSDINEDYVSDNVAILRENILQIKTNDENIAIHEHHDNGKGTSDLSVSKYYSKKVKSYNNPNPKSIARGKKTRDKVNKKIERLII